MNDNQNPLLLGFDIGTSGLKCVALEAGTWRTFSVYSEWELLSPVQGYAEFDCDELWRHITKCVSMLHSRHGLDLGRVRSIGFCALCPGLIDMDADGKELSRCIIFMDARSGEETQTINGAVPFEESFPIVANRIMSGATSITTIMWIKKHMPQVYDKTKYFVHLPSWAGYKLTGRMRMDLSNASGTGLYDVHAQAWSGVMTEASGVDARRLPPLAEAVEPLGCVSNADFLRLGIRPDTVVSCGAGDTVCALLALGVRPGDAMLSLGTSHVLYAVSQHDRFAPMLMGRSFVYKDAWALGGAMSNPGGMLRWFRDGFCQDLVRQAAAEGRSAYELISEEASHCPPGAGGVICLPYINGERSPVYDSKARAVFLGVNFLTDRASLARSIMEGAGYGVRQLMELMEETTGERIGEINVTGGGSRGELLVQIMADVTGRELCVNTLADVGAVGAALTGAIAAGICTKDKLPALGREERRVLPRPENSEVYERGYRKYLALYPSTKEIFELP